jgi:thioredoxin
MIKRIPVLTGLILTTALLACSSPAKESPSEHSTPDSSAGVRSGDGKVMSLTAVQFRQLVWDYSKHADTWIYQGDLPAIVDFYADWCRPCKLVAPIMDELAKEYHGKIRIYKVDTEKEKELARVFNIRSIPAVLFIPKEGKPQMSVGALPKPTFVQAIEEVLLGKKADEVPGVKQ